MEAIASPSETRQRHWLWPTRRRFVIGFLIALVIWGWLDVRNRGRYSPADHYGHKTDFTVYTEAGAAFFDGRPPYEVTNPRGWGYLYPPLFAISVAPLHQLVPENQVYIWFLISLAACWGCFLELRRIGRLVLPATCCEGSFGRIPTWLGAVASGAAAIPALNCLQRGQVGVAKLYLLLWGFRLIVENRALWQPFCGACLLALAVTLKVTPLIPACAVAAGQLLIACHDRHPERKRAAVATSAGLAFGMVAWLFLVPALALGWQSNVAHLGTWWKTVGVRAESISEDDFAGNSTTVRNQSLANAAYRLGNWSHYMFAGGPSDLGPEQRRKGGSGLLMDSAWADRAILALRVTAGLLLIGVCYRLSWTGNPLDQAALFGMACLATLVVFTIARGHYYMLLLPANVFVPLWLVRSGRVRLALGMAVAPLILVFAHYLALDYAGRVGVLGLGTALWYFAGCGLLLTAPLGNRAVSAPPNVLSRRADPERPLAA